MARNPESMKAVQHNLGKPVPDCQTILDLEAMEVAVVQTELMQCTGQITTIRTPTIVLSQAGCPSCHAMNSASALKASMKSSSRTANSFKRHTDSQHDDISKHLNVNKNSVVRLIQLTVAFCT